MSTAELLEKIQALPAPLHHRVEDFVEALAAQALTKPEDPFFARVEALRDQIRTEYWVCNARRTPKSSAPEMIPASS